MKKIYFVLSLLCLSAGAFSQFNINTAATNYTEDFNTLTSGTWTDNTLLTGWYARTDLTSPIATYAANTGTTTTAGLYAFGVAGTNPLTDRALGYSPTNAFTGGSGTGKGYIGWRLKNNTGGPISSITVTWSGEEWRVNGNAVNQNLVLTYQQAATVTALTGGTWTTTTSTFTSPIIAGTTALDGNAPANRVANISIVITVNIPAGEEIMLRWEDLNDTGNDHFLAIDDVTVNATAGAGGTPDIVLSSPNPAVAAGNIAQGSTSATNNPIYRFDLAVTTADAVLNGVTVTTAGTYAATDITNFKCWYSSDATFSPGTDVLLSTKVAGLGAGTQVFPSFTNQTITSGTTGYIFITSDITCAAVVGNNISVNAITTADISFVSGNKSGSAFAGDLQTIIAATPNNVTVPAASVANASSSLSWTNPAGCYDEVLIVASSGVANSGTPTGDGTAYTGGLVFGAGTALGNGFVVYKGTASPQVVTGLTNGTQYFYKFFTRFGTTWSAGVEVSATPALVTVATDYFRSVASGSWATLATWESSNDSTAWIPATLVPGAAAAHVTIQSPDSVWLDASRTTANLTIASGAKMNAVTFTMTATARFHLLGTASYYQGGTVVTIPGTGFEQILSTTSNYHFNGTQAGGTAAFPEFGNLYWEPTASGAGTFANNTATAPFYNGLVVRGNMFINIQGGTAREVRFATGAGIPRYHTIDGNLNISSASTIAVVTNGSNAIDSRITIGGNINISAGILQGTSTTPATSGSAVINLGGNINNTGGTIQTGFSTAGKFSLNYVGTGAQSINNTGGLFKFTANQLDSVNKPTGELTLNTPIADTGTIRFISGIVNTTSANLLTMAPGSAVSNAGNASFVNGPVKKMGNTAFEFPIGKTGTGLVPFAISNFTGTLDPVNDGFTAEYMRSSAYTVGAIITDPLINHISACDHWIVNRTSGTPTVDITAYWNSNNPCNGTAYVDDLTKLAIVHYDGANWNSSSVGFSSTTGTIAAGTISWPGVTVFSPFSLGSTSYGANPLPISINYITGIKQNGNHLLNWKVTCNSSPTANMILERSSDGRNYSGVYNITATALQCQQPFNYTDAQPAAGVNYYRLKMTDASGKVSYSSVVSLINAVRGIDVMNIAPNPINGGKFNLRVSAAQNGRMDVLVTDMQGRVMQRQSASLVAGFNQVPVNVSALAAGSYQVLLITAEGRTVQRFVIQ